MLVIRLQRIGKKKKPTYRLIINEKHRDTKGSYKELLGHYNPHTKDASLKEDRIKYWFSVGAQASNTVHNLLVSKGVIEGDKRRSVTVSKKSKDKKDKGKEEKAEKPKDKGTEKPQDKETEKQEAKPEEKTEEQKEEPKSEEKKDKVKEEPKAEEKKPSSAAMPADRQDASDDKEDKPKEEEKK